MNEMTYIHLGILLMLGSLLFNVLRVNMPKIKRLKDAAWVCMLASLLSLIVSLALRSVSAKYFALSNMYESMLMLIMWGQVVYLFLDRKFNLPALGWVASLFLLAALAWDTTLPTDIHPLQAALQSYWRSIHVPIIIASYAFFTVAFLTSLIYLVKHTMESRPTAMGLGQPLLATEPAGLLKELRIDQEELPEANGTTAPADGAVAATDSAAIYDEITYRCVLLGFPLLTIGIILGGLWANEAWGNYWSWDPKESMSLATLLGYGVYLHMRINGEHSARTLSWVSVAGFILLLVTYFGVNIMGIGLHSYGKIG